MSLLYTYKFWSWTRQGAWFGYKNKPDSWGGAGRSGSTQLSDAFKSRVPSAHRPSRSGTWPEAMSTARAMGKSIALPNCQGLVGWKETVMRLPGHFAPTSSKAAWIRLGASRTAGSRVPTMWNEKPGVAATSTRSSFHRPSAQTHVFKDATMRQKNNRNGAEVGC